MLFLKIQIISSIPFCFPLLLSSHQSLSSSLHCQLKFKAFYSSMVIAIHMGSPKLSISTGRHYVPLSKLVCQAREDNLVEKCLPFKQAWEPEFQSPELPLPTTHTQKPAMVSCASNPALEDRPSLSTCWPASLFVRLQVSEKPSFKIKFKKQVIYT